MPSGTRAAKACTDRLLRRQHQPDVIPYVGPGDGRFVVYAADYGTTGNLVLWRKDLSDNKKTQITDGATDDYDPDIGINN